MLEVAVAFVDEVELLPGALEEAALAHRGTFGPGGEGDVDARGLDLGAPSLEPGDQRLGCQWVGVGGHQQAAAGDGGERHADLELGVVVEPGAVVGVGPGVIEDVFAHRMGLDVAGRHRLEPARLALDHDVGRHPPGAAAHRLRAFQREEEGVGDERVEALALAIVRDHAAVVGDGEPGRRDLRVGAAIPLLGIELRDRLHDAHDGRRLHETSLPLIGAPRQSG